MCEVDPLITDTRSVSEQRVNKKYNPKYELSVYK